MGRNRKIPKESVYHIIAEQNQLTEKGACPECAGKIFAPFLTVTSALYKNAIFMTVNKPLRNTFRQF